jgi:hypothetical protein
MRLALSALALALTLSACGSTPEPVQAPAPVTSTSSSSPSPTESATVDNEAVGREMADSDTTARAILEGVWRETPKAKRSTTCEHWRDAPSDVYGVFSMVQPDVVKAYFDEACRAY